MPNKKSEQPWERQKGESAQAFEAFFLYLEMGADRTHQAVSQECSKSISLIRRWSSAYHWVERCRAWDNHLQHEAQKAAIAEAKSMTRRHIKMAQKIQDAAMIALQNMGSRMVTPQNFAAVVKLAAELERANVEIEVKTTTEAVSGAQETAGPNTLADAINEAWEKRSEEDEP